MTDENTLLQYKEEHFGRFISIKPKTYSDLKPFRNTKFPTNMFPEENKKNNFDLFILPQSTKYNYSNITPSQPYQYIPGLVGSSFYDSIKNIDTGKYQNVPKRIPIIKHGEFKIKHKLTCFENTIYELLCIFPPDIEVPGTMRMFNYFGLAEWFESFSAPDEEIQNFIKNYKSKINYKY